MAQGVKDLKANSSSRKKLQKLYVHAKDREVGRMIVSKNLFPLYLLDDLEDYKEAVRRIVLGEVLLVYRLSLYIL